jgi:acetyl-CoA carboxylase biotin carboxyl carrier protein
MPRATEPTDRTPEQRAADHASLATLADGLVPALVAKLNASGLGEVEIREGDWRIRVRRPAGAPAPTASIRRTERPRSPRDGTLAEPRTAHPVSVPIDDDPTQAVATSPAVGMFKASVRPGSRVTAGDRIGIVDLLGIPQDVVAPIDGTLVELLVESGSAVEYGEPVATLEGATAPAVTSGEG